MTDFLTLNRIRLTKIRSHAMSDKPRVLILGGGFAGLGAAQNLAKSEVEITMIDKHNYHTFQPMLYQVATDLIATEEVGHPLRDIFHEQPNVRLHTDTVTGIDLANRQVQFQEIAPFTYDYLVLALGLS
jgi:NADH dehydrogenase